MPRQSGDAGLHSLSTCGNEATARCRELVPRCASCGNAGSVQAVALRLKINPPLLHALRQNRYCLILEAPPINAIEGAFSASIVLIALVVLCDQDLLGRLSFDSVGRALRPKSKSSIQMNGKSCKANPEVTRSARQPSGFWSSASSSSRKSSYMLSKTRIRGIMPPPVRLLPFCKLEDKQSV